MRTCVSESVSECVSVTHLGAWTQVGMHIFWACGYKTRILCVTMTSMNAMSAKMSSSEDLSDMGGRVSRYLCSVRAFLNLKLTRIAEARYFW